MIFSVRTDCWNRPPYTVVLSKSNQGKGKGPRGEKKRIQQHTQYPPLLPLAWFVCQSARCSANSTSCGVAGKAGPVMRFRNTHGWVNFILVTRHKFGFLWRHMHTELMPTINSKWSLIRDRRVGQVDISELLLRTWARYIRSIMLVPGNWDVKPGPFLNC